MSLVPSVTETLLAWGIVPVACTRFCEQPDLPHVGGTKDPDLEAIVGLDPDLVVVCDEENRREDAHALVDHGLVVHACSPRSVDDVRVSLHALGAVLGIAVPAGLDGGVGPEEGTEPLDLRAFVPIWRRPWMTIGPDTYGASLLARLGVTVVGPEAPLEGASRYPEIDLDVVRSWRPDVVLAPSEPYAFRPKHLAELAGVAPVVPVDGQDLFWWGVRTPAAAARLHAAIRAAGLPPPGRPASPRRAPPGG